MLFYTHAALAEVFRSAAMQDLEFVTSSSSLVISSSFVFCSNRL